MSEPKVFVFWDNSNIFISAKDVAESRDGFFARSLVRVHFENLYDLACAGRPVGSALAVGSIPPELRELWEKLRRTGVSVELSERGAMSHKEQAVDTKLQTAMLRAIEDNEQPQIAVLLTGDGAGYDDGVGFHADLQRMYRKGWGIEVLAWDYSCKNTLKQWAASVGVYVSLDHYYDAVTFLEGGRRQSPLVLSNRHKATPRDYDPVKNRRRERALRRSRKVAEAAKKRALKREKTQPHAVLKA